MEFTQANLGYPTRFILRRNIALAVYCAAQQKLLSERHNDIMCFISKKGTFVPTTATLDQHQRISNLAYKLWEEEGRPNDRAELHWLQAETMVNAETMKPVKKPAARSKARKA